MKNISKKAFSLAEVLVSLAIIGVIASLTVPNLIYKINERKTVTQLKKVYAELDHAYEYAKLKYGPVPKWNLTASQHDENGSHIPNNSEHLFLKRLLSETNAEDIMAQKIQAQTSYMNNKPDIWFPSHRFPDGVLIWPVWLGNPNCNKTDGKLTDICADFRVDINGLKGPNELGRDQFQFYVTKEKIVPIGEKGQVTRKIPDYCNLTDKEKLYHGMGCTAWVIHKENMDYLKGKTIQWE